MLSPTSIYPDLIGVASTMETAWQDGDERARLYRVVVPITADALSSTFLGTADPRKFSFSGIAETFSTNSVPVDGVLFPECTGFPQSHPAQGMYLREYNASFRSISRSLLLVAVPEKVDCVDTSDYCSDSPDDILVCIFQSLCTGDRPTQGRAMVCMVSLGWILGWLLHGPGCWLASFGSPWRLYSAMEDWFFRVTPVSSLTVR